MIETEWNLLGAFIRDNSLVDRYPCDPQDFSDKLHSEAYGIIRDLVGDDEVASIASVSDRMKSPGALQWVEDLVNNTVTANVGVYWKMIRKAGRVRRAQVIGGALSSATPDEIESCLGELLALSHSEGSHESTITKATSKYFDFLDEVQAGKPPGVTSGLAQLDEKLGWFQACDLITIASRSQHGKTALMMHIANSQTAPVGLISGEQPSMQLGMRSLASIGRVNLKNMRTGRLSSKELEHLDSANKLLHDRPIYIFDKGNPSIYEIEAVARQWVHYKGIKILLVDYLQLVSGGEGEEHRLQIGDVAYHLKALAKQLEIPIVCLAQVARAIDSRPPGPNYLGRMPYTANLADSAKIEDASDQIITLYRPSVYWPDIERLKGLAFLNICKNRHGPVGHICVKWIGEYVQFEDQAA